MLYPIRRSSEVRRKPHWDSDQYTVYGCGVRYIFPWIANRPLPCENGELVSKKVREINQIVLHSFFPISYAALSSYSYSQFFRCWKLLIVSLNKMFTFSIIALNIHNRKQTEINSKQKMERDHAIILIAHFHPSRFFSELTFLYHVSTFNNHHFGEGKEI